MEERYDRSAEYLYYGIANNWIDTTKLDIQSRYSNADDVFTALLDDCFRDLEQDPAFETDLSVFNQ